MKLNYINSQPFFKVNRGKFLLEEFPQHRDKKVHYPLTSVWKREESFLINLDE